jgi:hypothetical protein
VTDVLLHLSVGSPTELIPTILAHLEILSTLSTVWFGLYGLTSVSTITAI